MNYKAPDNTIHYLDDAAFEYLLPVGSLAITDDEAAEILASQVPEVTGPSIQEQIDTLERAAMLPRSAREFMLRAYVKEANDIGADLNNNKAYVKLKAVDDQIAALRSQL